MINTIGLHPNFKKYAIGDILNNGDRLFYELGYKRNSDLGYGDNWVRTGRFKEIENPIEYIKKDNRMEMLEFVEHHNFMILTKGNSL